MPKRTRDKINLTEPFIKALKPASKAYEVFDARLGGFSVQVYPTGKKTYFVNYNANGKRKRLRIGEPKLLKVSEARNIATQNKKTAKSGVDLTQERRRSMGPQKAMNSINQHTVAKLADEFIDQYCIGEGNEPSLKSWEEYQRILNKYVIPHWGNLEIQTISIGALTTLLDTIAKQNGLVMANRVLAVTRKLFNWTRGRGIIDYVPIVPNIARKEKARSRFLNDDEIIEFWKGCEKESYPFGKLYQLLLLTGQQLGEVANMRWTQIDIAYEDPGQLYKVWKLPSHSTKIAKTHLVPLSPMADELISSMPRFQNCDLLFPSSRSNDRPISGFGKSKKRVCTLKTDWRLRDLRRTVRTNLYRLKIDHMICNKVFGHIDQGLDERYDNNDYLKQKQDALTKWSQSLTDLFLKKGIISNKLRKE